MTQSLAERSAPYKLQMKAFALAKPLSSIQEYREAARTYSHGKLLKIGNDQYIAVTMAIITYENQPVWKCKMSLVTPDDNKKPRQKPLKAWKKGETAIISQLLEYWLEDCGMHEGRKFFNTPSARHYQKLLTADEFQRVWAKVNENGGEPVNP